MFVSRDQDLLELDPFWLPSGSEDRPLMENLWANDDYRNDYLCHLQQMLDSGFDETTIKARVDELADLIRADLYADPNKLYSNSQFEANLYSNIQDGRTTVYGLTSFVQQRADFLRAVLADYGLDCDPDSGSSGVSSPSGRPCFRSISRRDIQLASRWTPNR